MKNDISPPVIEATELSELMLKAKFLHEQIGAKERRTLEDAIQLGRLLAKAKDACKHGEWGKELDKAGISRSSDSVYQSLAKFPALEISKCESIREALDAIAKTKQPDADQCEDEGGTGTDDDSTEDENAKMALGRTPADRREPGEEDDTGWDASGPHPVDKAGTPLPAQAIPAFDCIPIFKQWCQSLDDLVKEAEEFCKGPGGRLMHFATIRHHLKNAHGNVIANIPSHVCPYCNGVRRKGHPDCECCKGGGWTAKHIFNQAPKQ